MKDRYIIAVLAVFLQIAVLVGCSGRESNSIEIASVNGEKILASDFDLAKAQYESKNMLDAELLDGLIKERIVLQYGEKIEDIITEEDGFEVVTAPEDFNAVRDALVEKGYEFVSADIKLIPQTTTVLDNEGQVKAMEKLIDLLEDDDDVQNVYHNWEITE